MKTEPLGVLRSVFGYEEFRPLQREIITNILQHRDTLAVMPTGGGKSLCYQIPAILSDGITIVVSPLISLMKDQVDQLTELGVGAVVLNSALSEDQYRENIARIMRNEIKLVYLAPETLLMQKTLALLSSRNVTGLAIDEAHCISEWGHDFRPEYRKLADVRLQFPNAVCTALTATATPQVRQDIRQILNFDASNEFLAGFDRRNLFLEIVQKNRPIEQTMAFLRKFPDQSGIVYCLSRRQVDELTERLTDEDFSVLPYHAGLPDAQRRHHQEQFIRDNVQIMVATIAFGMGINKPNIRFILHYDLPQNIESYYQQIGRAGRDGLRAHCLLLFGYADIQKIKYFINQKADAERRVADIHLNALVGLAETEECRRIPLLRYFGEPYDEPRCGMCDNCLKEKKTQVDLTIPAQKFLSCVKRTGERFGAGHIIDVLRGSKAQKVLRFGHEQLSTYGIGLEYSKNQWFYLSRKLLHNELLQQDAEFGGLKLTANAWEVLKSRRQLWGTMPEETSRDSRPEPDQPGEQPNHDAELFEQLRKKRKALADEADVPPYAVFPDKSLIEMAIFFPQSREGFLQVHGVGRVKLEKYGDIFLELLRNYCQAADIQEKDRPSSGENRQSVNPSPDSEPAKRRYAVVAEAFNAGQSVESLCEAYKVKLSTILGHLYTYTQEGHALRSGDDLLTVSSLSAEKQAAVLEKFERFGTLQLKPVFEALDQQVDYDELHLLRLHFLRNIDSSLLTDKRS